LEIRMFISGIILMLCLLTLNSKGLPRTPVMTKHGETIVGDIIYNKEQMASLKAAEQQRWNRNGNFRVRMPDKLWKNGIIYYELKDYSPDQKEDIRNSLEILSESTDNCLQFHERTSGPRAIVKNECCCKSQIGKQAWVFQYIHLKADRCLGPGMIQHEFMHTAGIPHTQTRFDRQKHVKIIENNFAKWKKVKTNYEILSEKSFKYHGLPYDYFSIMHYGKDAWGKKVNGKKMMTLKTNDPKMQNMIGQQVHVSAGDIKLIKRMYGCPETGEIITSTNYPREYPKNHDMIFPLIGDPDSVITLKFIDFYLEDPEDGICKYDWIKVEDADGNTLMDKTCGNSKLGTKVFDTNHVVLKFHTDEIEQKPGFMVEWIQDY